MKKFVKILISITLLFFASVSIVSAEETESERKERLFSYTMYSVIRNDNQYEVKEDITALPIEEIIYRMRLDILDKLNPEDGELVIWNPDFVLELAPIEFPDLYDDLYDALLSQGYNTQTGIIGEGNFITDQYGSNPNSRNVYGEYYTHATVVSGHGTVIVSRSYVGWTYNNGELTVTVVNANITGGWSQLLAHATIGGKDTQRPYGFYSYATIKGIDTYAAYSQYILWPNPSGYITFQLMSEDVSVTGISGFPAGFPSYLI